MLQLPRPRRHHPVHIKAQLIHRHMIWSMVRRRIQEVEHRLVRILLPDQLSRAIQEYVVIDAQPGPWGVCRANIESTMTGIKASRRQEMLQAAMPQPATIPELRPIAQPPQLLRP